MKISIITTSYNSESTINDTLLSVLNQTYEDVELIVVDGLSVDDTVNIIKSYSEKFKKSQKSFKWISEKDCGIYDAINKGIKMATGEIIGILNSDDYYFDNEVIGDIVQAFQEDSVDCVYGNLIYIDSLTGKTVREWKSKEFIAGLFEKSWTPAHPTFYCKKSIYQTYGTYKTDYKIAADVELMYRFLEKKSISSKYIDRKFIKMRQGGVSSSGLKSTVTITKELQKAFMENGDSLNLLKYLFFKGLKIKEFIVKNN